MQSLAPEVRAAIANQKQQVVGVVYNAVDDHLSGPDRSTSVGRWRICACFCLLREAREARRVVIITADHGHLLEDGTTQIPGGESDRWRLGSTARIAAGDCDQRWSRSHQRWFQYGGLLVGRK